MKNKNLLVIAPSKGEDCTFYLIVAETGEVLADHFCGSESFAREDLYINRDERKERIRIRFGEVEIKFLNETEITLQELGNKHKEWRSKQNN